MPASPRNRTGGHVLLSSGIPLEMEVYDILVSTLDADWIEPEYEFPALDEDQTVIKRSVDFVAAVNSIRSPFSPAYIFFLIECKYAAPDRTWLFMTDQFPSFDSAWDLWRPALWQDKEPQEPLDPAMLGPRARYPFPLCARGTALSEASSGSDAGEQRKATKMPGLDSGLHQLRDALHSVAIERFRLFTKWFDQPECIIFVPILVTNAPLRLLHKGVFKTLTTADADHSLDALGDRQERLLVRCPGHVDHVDWKWGRFWAQHGTYDLSRIVAGLPPYKRPEQYNLEFHIKSFFRLTPAYVTVTTPNLLPSILTEVVEWTRKLEFRSQFNPHAVPTDILGHLDMAIARASADCQGVIGQVALRVSNLLGILRGGGFSIRAGRIHRTRDTTPDDAHQPAETAGSPSEGDPSLASSSEGS